MCYLTMVAQLPQWKAAEGHGFAIARGGRTITYFGVIAVQASRLRIWARQRSALDK